MANKNGSSAISEQVELKAEKKSNKPLAPVWDKWLLYVTPTQGKPKNYTLKFIDKERTGVVMEQHSVDMLNEHSHSTMRRYMPVGEELTGQTIEVTIK